MREEDQTPKYNTCLLYTSAVHSQADKESLHVSLADESVCVGKALPGESYLRQKDIITAALLTGAQAVSYTHLWRTAGNPFSGCGGMRRTSGL